ncbi:MAG: lipopolysaccharide transport periplasmic protein LptA [Cytophagales bacterium]|nr:lipopolysaccharide transport periplasmic protein LptA [Cytophagales bacterium]
MKLVLVGLVCLSAQGMVWAEKADKNKPLNLEADSARFDDVQKIMVAEGAVVVTKGTMVLRAARLEQREDPQGNQFLVATPQAGGTAFFRQKREGLDEFMEGEAERIEYDGKVDVLKLTGRAVMRRLRGSAVADEATGYQIVFNNLTETMNVNGAAATGATASTPAGSGRVRMVLSPKLDKTASPASSDAAPALLLKSVESLKP